MSFDEKAFIDANVKRVVDQIAEEERERCCKDVCLDCAKGTPVVYWPLVDRYTHVVNDFRHACTANAIRQRAAKE